MPIRVLLTLTGCVCLLAAVVATPASAKRTLAELRVEGPAGTLDPGTWYVTGGERIRRSRSGDRCVRDQGRFRFPGATALGIPQTGSESRHALRQVRVRMDEAGPFVCEIGGIKGRPFDPDTFDFAGWSYWLDFEFGAQSADLVTLERGDGVLWVFGDFGAEPVNTGSALELLDVPPQSDDGEFVVRVIAHSFDGSSAPADGATIEGASQVTGLGGGRYEVVVGEGRTRLKATSGVDIASNQLTACVAKRAEDCPRAHGRWIVGSERRDRLRGTKGWDKIASGGGPDRIKIANGGRDKVNCGGGDDHVRLKRRDRDDRIASNCEEVIRPG